MALNKIERGHQMYRDGLYKEALGFYTEAIGMAKTNPQKIALHSNRAACFLKLHHFKKVLLFFFFIFRFHYSLLIFNFGDVLVY
jgi:hypothetical protein